MSRYIDADDVANAIYHHFPSIRTMADARGIIEDAPSIDIVRCKECKHNYATERNHGKMQPRCDFTDWKLKENDFCSRGERAEQTEPKTEREGE